MHGAAFPLLLIGMSVCTHVCRYCSRHVRKFVCLRFERCANCD